MTLKEAQCPNCGGELQLPDGKETVICMYCDTSIIVSEAIEKKYTNNSGNLETWFELARTAKEGGNDIEAIEYFNKILEVNASNAEAWYGKGYCIFNTSTLANIKLNEAITYFKNAVKYSSDKIKMKEEVASSLNESANSLFSTSMNHYNEFHETDDAATDLAVHSSYCLDALKLATEYDNQKVYVENALQIFKEGNGSLLNQANEYKEYFHNKMKELDPNWTPPKSNILSNSDSSSYCFIATATMGDYDHPIVIDLRVFRDQWLLERKWGRSFVELYYKYGPYFANAIESHTLLKKISYLLIIKPLHFITNFFIHLKKQESHE